MKSKWIKVLLRRKVDSWLDTIEDSTLRESLRDQIIVTGGCIASMLLGEDVNDFDIYFRNKDAARKVAEYYVKKWNTIRAERVSEANAKKEGKRGRKFSVPVPVYVKDDPVRGFKIVVKSAGVIGENSENDYQYYENVDPLSGDQESWIEKAMEVVEDEESDGDCYRPVFVSGNAISLKGRIQLIFRFYGEPEEIHNNYDFVHCTNYWTSWGGLVLKPEALEALLSKELKYVGSKYPICSIFRTRKFQSRGWSITAGQLFKICHQISQLDLNNFEVLEDQLTGVDTAYFIQIIEALRERNPDKVDETYLLQLIDKVF